MYHFCLGHTRKSASAQYWSKISSLIQLPYIYLWSCNAIFTSYPVHKVQLVTYKHEYNQEIEHFASYSDLLFLLQFTFEMKLTKLM